MGTVNKKKAQQIRRKKRVRKKIFGTGARPRMSVFRSAKHIYVQVIDDNTGATLASASSLSPEVKTEASGLNKKDIAKKVGTLAAKRCLDAKVNTVVFDRNGFMYSGRIAAVADAAREAGLKF
jgi:large subunit ribosomal protein L18